jgi:hypothetical protein
MTGLAKARDNLTAESAGSVSSLPSCRQNLRPAVESRLLGELRDRTCGIYNFDFPQIAESQVARAVTSRCAPNTVMSKISL